MILTEEKSRQDGYLILITDRQKKRMLNVKLFEADGARRRCHMVTGDET